MDLAGMINNGDEALHRGSVDKSATSSSSDSNTPPRAPSGGGISSSPQGADQPEIPGLTRVLPHKAHGNPPSPGRDAGTRSPRDRTDSGLSPTSVQRPSSRGGRGGARGGSRGGSRGFPVWAEVYKGPHNKVRDTRRWQLAELRPELVNIFPDPSEDDQPSNDADADGDGYGEAEAEAGAGADGLEPPQAAAPGGNAFHTPFIIPPASASEIGPGGNVSLTGLSASLASLIPNDDQTKVLAGWIFERIGQITDDSLIEHVEVEFKMGLICDEHSGMRHLFPIMSEAVVNPSYLQQKSIRFKTEIDNARFKTLESLLNSIAQANVANEMNPITHENVLIRDESYSVQHEVAGRKISRVRVSYDDKQRIVECISKQRIGDLYISMPNAAYDLKMSLSIEHPIDVEAIMPQIKNAKSSFERNKNRLKWTSPGCVVDLTSVHGMSAHKSPIVTKEAEIETNSKLLSSVIAEYRSASDKSTSLNKFLEVIRYTMDSARFLTRNI